MPPSTLADIQTAALRLGPQTYSAAAEDELSSSTAGSLHSRRSQAFQTFISTGGGAGTYPVQLLGTTGLHNPIHAAHERNDKLRVKCRTAQPRV